ncbi:MAG: glycosyltransferase [Pseudomonadota bacterium]
MDRVVVLMGVKNGEQYLSQQLRSIAWQRGVDWRLIVSDDGSVDGSCEIIGEFSKAHAGRVTYMRGPETGLASNYLYLLQECQPNCYVALADQDDIWLPGKLIRAIEMLSKDADKAAIYSGSSYVLAPSNVVKGAEEEQLYPSFGNALVQNILAGHSIVMTPRALSLANEIQPSEPPPFHDWWLYALFSGMNCNILCDRKPQVLYRQHSEASLGANIGIMARLKRMRLIGDGTYRQWLREHHAALLSVARELPAENRRLLEDFTGAHLTGLSVRSMLKGQVRRQSVSASLVMSIAIASGIV